MNELISNIEIEELPDQLDLSIWESGLIECYRNTNNWTNLLQLSELTNNLEIPEKWDWRTVNGRNYLI